MKIIQQAWIEESTTYALFFQLKGESEGSGFAFDCDANGVPTLANEAAADNYRKCLDGTYDVVALGIEEYHHRYRHPRVGKCECGCKVYLANFTNTCDRCGADYNSSGQRLAPRHFWGEETGEHWSECY